MWGRQFLDNYCQTNFNIGYLNTKSDTLIHLTQWQYWWWFWFMFVWVLYYLIVFKTSRSRVLKFKPQIATTVRPHGKWGDLIVCLIPISWCANILINSNFLLKLIEWQNNATLITLRVRGKQWYWVYKFDSNSIYKVLTRPKNIGHNKWYFTSFGKTYRSEDYTTILNMKNRVPAYNKHWKGVFDRTDASKKYSSNIYSNSNLNKTKLLNNDVFKKYNSIWNFNKDFLGDNFNYLNKLDNKSSLISMHNEYKINNKTLSNYKLFSQQNMIESFNLLCDFSDDRVVKRGDGCKPAIKFVNVDHNMHWSFLKNNGLICYEFGTGKNVLDSKKPNDNSFLNIKQKRIKLRTTKNSFIKDINSKKINIADADSYALNDNFRKESISKFEQYYTIKKLKNRSDVFNKFNNKRLLRTRRTLVLPAHLHITAVTSSYDVIHSWYIPGLGLKMDCIPGRSVHHTFYVNHPGYYYGQCAEVCGRYHHHMPIRICALPFEHFLVWWNHFGVNRLLLLNYEKELNKQLLTRKMIW